MQKHMQANNRKSGINTKNSCKTSFKQKITKIIQENVTQTKNYKKITQNLHISQLYPKFALRNARNALAGPIAQLVRAPDS